MPSAHELQVLELRRYTLHQGRRDELIELFDRELVETQEAVGITVVGQFRDLAQPDHFVWVRGFPDMPSRAESLAAFYGGPVWRAHREAANATMIDSDDVLLLRPVTGFSLADASREAPPSPDVVVVTIYHCAEPLDEFVRFFDERVRPLLVDGGAEPLASLRTEPAENTFPALPVRTGENAYVWFARYPSADAYRESVGRWEESPAWRDGVAPELAKRLSTSVRTPVGTSVLTPTGRSLLR